ncbi:MAG TPA: alpha/beta hydrolase [Ktedonobacteraceae bacterium]|nr:alpha/beta hydrolase [Ktedonobacteraceae bacterium]
MPMLPTDEFITIHNLRFHYRRWMSAASGAQRHPLLLLHGLASALRIWDLVAPLLAEHGHEVVTLDQRGHGESAKPNDGYDFATIVRDDAAIVHELGLKRFGIVGHSWGASVALEYAATYPDEISALLLVDGASGQLSARSGWSREIAIERLAPPRFAGTSRAAFVERIKQGPLGRQWSEQLEDILLNIVELRPDNTVAPRLAFENHLQIIGSMWDQPTYELYSRVHCPITLIVAEPPVISEAQVDFFNQRRAGLEQIQQLRPDINIVHMRDTIHDIPLHRPRELAELIDRATSSIE